MLAVPPIVEPVQASVPSVVDVPLAPETPELPNSISEPVKAAALAVVVEQEKVKRLTIDIPDSLHRRVKSRCGQEGVKMVDVIRGLLETRFPES